MISNEELTGSILSAFYEVHRELGHGFLEASEQLVEREDLRPVGVLDPRRLVVHRGDRVKLVRLAQLQPVRGVEGADVGAVGQIPEAGVVARKAGRRCEADELAVARHEAMAKRRRDAGEKELVSVGRACVLAVALVAIWLAYDPENTILGLVANAWAGFGAAFGPVVILALTWKRLTRDGALAGILVGAATVLFWIYAPVLSGGAALSSLIYEIVPGFLLGGLAAILVSLAGSPPPESVVRTFDESQAELRAARAL